MPDQAGSVSLLDDELMSLGEKARAKAHYFLLDSGQSAWMVLVRDEGELWER